jgi:hypothetical protein
MKIVTVTLKKESQMAYCFLYYEDDRWPEGSEWRGNVDSFRLDNGRSLDLMASLDQLEKVVDFQARKMGAEYELTDDGGSCRKRGYGRLDAVGSVVDKYVAIFRKDGSEAACDIRYWGGADEPMNVKWSGHVEVFRMPDGDLPKVSFPQEIVKVELESQAKLLGAGITISHESSIIVRND